MQTKTATAIIAGVIGSALLVAAFLLKAQPRWRRLVFTYMGALFYIYGALEFFGVIHLETN